MNDLLTYIFGCVTAGFFGSIVGFILWRQEREGRLAAESEYSLLAAKLDRLEELQAQAEKGNNELLARLQHAHGHIVQLQHALHHGSIHGMIMGMQQPTGGTGSAMTPDEREDLDLPEEPSGKN